MFLIATRPLTAVDLIAIEVEGGGHTHTHTASSEINTTKTLPCQRQVPTPQHRALPANANAPLPARHDRVCQETGRDRKDTKDTGRVPDLPLEILKSQYPSVSTLLSHYST